MCWLLLNHYFEIIDQSHRDTTFQMVINRPVKFHNWDPLKAIRAGVHWPIETQPHSTYVPNSNQTTVITQLDYV